MGFSFFRTSKLLEPRPRNVSNFFAEFTTIAKPAGEGCFAFAASEGLCRGFVQFIIDSEQAIQIHRLWTLTPGNGDGSFMMCKLCELADRHGVELKLKVIPIGRKPHPFSREQLKAWYERHGFKGPRWRLLRKPTCLAEGSAQ